MNKNVKYLVIGAGLIAAYWYAKKKGLLKGKTKSAYTAPNLQVAQQYFAKIQDVYKTVPSGQPLPKNASDQIVALMVEIEKNGFTVNSQNQLVKQVKG